MRKQSRETARILVKFHDSEFGKKQFGRFRISRKNLKRLLGVSEIRREDINTIKDHLWREGYSFINEDSFFAVVPRKTLVRWRLVPTAMVEEKAADFEEDNDG